MDLTALPRHWLDGLLYMGLGELSDTDKSKRFTFNIMALMGSLAAAAYATFYALYDFDGLRPAWITASACMLTVLLPLLANFSLRTALYFGVLLVILVFSYLTYLLGTDTGLYLYMIVGIVAVSLVNGRENLFDTILFWIAQTVAMLICMIFFTTPALVNAVDPTLQKIVFFSVVVLLSLLLGFGILTLTFRVAAAERALAAEHARSEALLDSLLPKHIASRLKAEPGRTIADHLPEVTILFADIAEFTPRASSMEPEELVAFLNRIFTRFDRLTEHFGLEKIKTIGDAYMVAAGMPVARDNHAEIIADMALAMQDEAARLSHETGQNIAFRIGIHSGSVVAGVIGSQKFFYDVWGDTVNTASRMESHSEIGRIQVTEATRDRLGPAYRIKLRGEIDIKGKGKMRTYWLTGKDRQVEL